MLRSLIALRSFTACLTPRFLRELTHPEGLFLWVTPPKFFLIPAITKAWGARYSGRAFLGQAERGLSVKRGEMADFREVVKDLVWQFACHSNDHSGKWLSTGGLSALANIMKRLAVPLRSYS